MFSQGAGQASAGSPAATSLTKSVPIIDVREKESCPRPSGVALRLVRAPARHSQPEQAPPSVPLRFPPARQPRSGDRGAVRLDDLPTRPTFRPPLDAMLRISATVCHGCSALLALRVLRGALPAPRQRAREQGGSILHRVRVALTSSSPSKF
jgi:hypothetical protein